MSVPTPHAPDEEWAQERTKRMGDLEKPTKPPLPGEEITASETLPIEESKSEVGNNAQPTSDDDVDELLKATPKDAEPEMPPAEDTETDKAVDDIMKKDGDEVLSAQDSKMASAVVMKPSIWEKLKDDISDWWSNPRERYITLGIVAALLVVIFSFPASRAFSLNLFGVRSTVHVRILDSTTHLPLKNVEITVGANKAKTDASGTANLPHIKLGTQKLQIHKVAFANISENIWVHSGTTNLSDIEIKAVGTRLNFIVTDYASGKPIANAEVSSGEANAVADKTGKAVLTISPSDASSINVQVTAKGYRSEKTKVQPSGNKNNLVVLVTDQKEVFVSKQSGKYDLYKVDVDGKNRKLILAATGNENQNISLSISPDGTRAALVSTRDNQRNAEGYLLSTLSLVDVETGANVTLEHAEDIRLISWADNRLVYEVSVAGASAANPNRQRIISYDYNATKRLQLASTNYFTDVVGVGSTVYYSVSATIPGITPSFVKINADGTGKQTVVNQEVWTVLRTAYDTFSLQTSTAWLGYTIGATATKAANAPGAYTSRQYVDSPDGRRSLWIDARDGKGVLVSYDIASQKEATVLTRAGLSTVVRWLDDTTAIYRVSGAQETADYIVNLDSKTEPKKITDVTAATGLSQGF